MKTVFDNDQTIHVWASQRQEAGRSNKGAVYFEGPALYSYGSHFLMGFILGEVAFLNSDKYSVTTSKHQTWTAYAVNHMQRIYLPDLTALRYALLDAKRDRAKESAGIVKAYIEAHATLDFHTLNALGRVFGFKVANVQAMQKRGVAAIAKNAKERAAEEKARTIREAKHLADMTETEFTEWAHRMAHVFEPMNFSYVSTMEKSVAALAKRLNVAARLGVKVLGVRRVAALKARRVALLARFEGMGARAIENHRAEIRATFESWRSQWDAAGEDMAARFAVMKNAPQSWRFHDSGRATIIDQADLERLQRAEQWAEDHESERKALEAEIREREAEQRRERESAQFSAWQRGEAVQCPQAYRSDGKGGAYVRRSPNGEELQTSQGASVPWSHALKAFAFIKLCRERGEAFHTNGRIVRVGHFTVSEITAQGDMVAGCHRFNWETMEALAIVQGVYDAPSSSEAVEQR